RGKYAFQLNVTDNDVATVGADAGLAGSGTAFTTVSVTGGTLVDVYVSAFIPAASVDNPLPFNALDSVYYKSFRGDNQIDANGDAIFAKGASARFWSSAIVDVDESQPKPGVYSAHDTGITVGYRWVFKDRKVFEASDTGKADASRFFESLYPMGESF